MLLVKCTNFLIYIFILSFKHVRNKEFSNGMPKQKRNAPELHVHHHTLYTKHNLHLPIISQTNQPQLDQPKFMYIRRPLKCPILHAVSLIVCNSTFFNSKPLPPPLLFIYLSLDIYIQLQPHCCSFLSSACLVLLLCDI